MTIPEATLAAVLLYAVLFLLLGAGVALFLLGFVRLLRDE